MEIHELPDIARLGHEFYGEAGFPCGEFIPDVFVKSWTGFLEAGLGVIFAWRIDGEIVGGIGGLRFPDPNNGDLTATELFWFITKEHRGGPAATKLLRQFEAWAVESGCKRASMVNLENEGSKGLPQFYARMGYRPLETQYIKEL